MFSSVLGEIWYKWFYKQHGLLSDDAHRSCFLLFSAKHWCRGCYIYTVSGNEAGSFQTLQTSTQNAPIGDKNWQFGSVITLELCFAYPSDLSIRYSMDKMISVPYQLLVICVILCAALANGNIIVKSNRYIVYMFLFINSEMLYRYDVMYFVCHQRLVFMHKNTIIG